MHTNPTAFQAKLHASSDGVPGFGLPLRMTKGTESRQPAGWTPSSRSARLGHARSTLLETLWMSGWRRARLSFLFALWGWNGASHRMAVRQFVPTASLAPPLSDEVFVVDPSLSQNPSQGSDFEFRVKRNDAASTAAAEDNMTASLANLHEAQSLPNGNTPAPPGARQLRQRTPRMWSVTGEPPVAGRTPQDRVRSPL